MQEPRWVTRDGVMAMHDAQLAEHGGLPGVRDPGALDSALGRPQNLFAYGGARADLAGLAAAYAFGIARNHAFVDGNKRTALAVCTTFLGLNAWGITATDEEMYDTFLRLGAGELAEGDLAVWLRARLVRV
jgi:death on curing protein